MWSLMNNMYKGMTFKVKWDNINIAQGITPPKARVRKQPNIHISFYMTSSCLPVMYFI
jgi:hypothetical protein